MSSPWVEPGTSCTTGSAIPLTLGYFWVFFASFRDTNYRKGFLSSRGTQGRGKNQEKLEKKFALDRGRTLDLDSQVAAILEFGKDLILSVFRVASRHKVPKGTLRTSDTRGRVKETGKRRKKFALDRERTRDLLHNGVRHPIGVGLVLGVFRVASQHQLPKGIPLVKRNTGKGKETGK